MNTLIAIGIAAAAAVVLVLGMFISVAKFYQVPKGDEALVKTGGKQPVVSTGGGLWIIPMFHRVARVSLQAIRVPIDRVQGDAVPSSDMIPAEIRGEMFVQVSPRDEKAIVLAVQSLGALDPNTMSRVVSEKINSQITDALRTAAFRKTFIELNSQKKEFAEDVVQLLGEDLAKLGLTLTSVAVTHVTQGAFTTDMGDVIAAQGRRNVAETVERNRQETNLINRNAEIAVQQQDVEAREKALALDLRQKQREADQTRQVQEYEAEQQAQAKAKVLLQQQAEAEAEAAQSRAVAEARAKESQEAEKANIAKAEAIAVRQSEANAKAAAAKEAAAASIAEAEADRKVREQAAAQKEEQAGINKERAIKVSNEQRQQAVEEAAVAREVAVAERRAEEAAARAKQAEAEAEQRRAEEAVITVKATAEADRQKRIVVIKADEDAERIRIAAQAQADKVLVEAEGYAKNLAIRAEAEFEAASKQADAKTKLAEATLAEGEAAAEARRKMVEAENAVGAAVVLRDVVMQAIDANLIPQTVRELMLPVANVAHDVKILQVSGLGANGEIDGLPATILNTGLAAAGVRPFLTEAMRLVADSPELAAAKESALGAVRATMREATAGLADGVKGSDNGVPAK